MTETDDKEISFQKDSGDQVIFDTKDVAHSSAAELLKTHFEGGRNGFREFMQRLDAADTALFCAPIKKKQILFFMSYFQLVHNKEFGARC